MRVALIDVHKHIIILKVQLAALTTLLAHIRLKFILVPQYKMLNSRLDHEEVVQTSRLLTASLVWKNSLVIHHTAAYYF